MFKPDLTLREDYDCLFDLYYKLLPIYAKLIEGIQAYGDIDMNKIDFEKTDLKTTFALMRADAEHSINIIYVMVINIMKFFSSNVQIKKINPAPLQFNHRQHRIYFTKNLMILP